jgi:formate dehydrogenase iron-sulfur subunit
MADKAMLLDPTRCTACRGCVVACKAWNDREAEETTNRGTYENPPGLSSKTWTTVKFKEEDGDNDVPRWLFTVYRCMHCTDAGCVKACTTGALYHHEMGFVALDQDKCIGCGYCASGCPFGVPQLDGTPFAGVKEKMFKCTFWQDRVSNGLEPACAKTCPPGAIQFGDRGTLLNEAYDRVEKLKVKRPGARVYGDDELKGLHMMYVLDDSPSAYGLPENPHVPVSTTLWQDILQPLGYVAAGVTAVGLLANFMVARARAIRNGEKR